MSVTVLAHQHRAALCRAAVRSQSKSHRPAAAGDRCPGLNRVTAGRELSRLNQRIGIARAIADRAGAEAVNPIQLSTTSRLPAVTVSVTASVLAAVPA